MSIPKPGGPYAAEMTDAGGWPEVDEDSLNSRADQLMDTLRQVTSVLESWMGEQPELFAPGSWSGSAAGAAGAKVVEAVNSLQSQQLSLATAILWYRAAATTVAATKGAITTTVESAQGIISAIEATAEINPDAQSEIDQVVAQAHGINVSAVSDAAAAMAVADFHPPATDLDKLIGQAGVPQTGPTTSLAAPGSQADSTPGETGTEAAKGSGVQNLIGGRPPGDKPPADGTGHGGGDDATGTEGTAENGSKEFLSPPKSTQVSDPAHNAGAPPGQTAQSPPKATQVSDPAANAAGPASDPAGQTVQPTPKATQVADPAANNLGPSDAPAAPSAPSSAASSPSGDTSPGSTGSGMGGIPGSIGSGSGGGSSTGGGGSSSSSSASSVLSGLSSGSGSGSSGSGAGGSAAAPGSGPAGGQQGSPGQSGSQGAQGGQGGGPAPVTAPPPAAAGAPAAPAAAAAAATPMQAPPPAMAPASAGAGGSAPTGAPGASAPGVGAPGVPGAHAGIPAINPAGPSGGLGGAGSGSGMGPGLPGGGGSGTGMAPMPLGPPPTPAPANPVPSAPAATGGPIGPSVNPASAVSAGTVAAPAPIPVSAARAEREAIAGAMNAEAAGARRSGSSGDAASLAVRIAAALNAADSPGRELFGFFWATGVTTRGHILVANSYGLGYIPAGLSLPEQVRLVSLDDTVPLADRAGAVTRPWRALLGWTQAKGVGLRTVIGTSEQLSNVDVGAAQQILADDDIPATSRMSGRDRLMIVAPEAARRLAATADEALTALLPPAPTDVEAPTDRTADLLFSVGTPLMSEATGREVAHLKALLAYADHCEELAIHAGHTAVDPAEQRTAIADGVYWNHLAALTDAALQSLSAGATSG